MVAEGVVEGVVGEGGVVEGSGRKESGKGGSGRRVRGCLRCYIFVIFVFPIRQGSKF